MLQDDLVRVAGPLEPGEVCVRRVTRRPHPDDGPARGRDDTGPDGRVRLAGLGMLEARRHRVEAVGVVDHGEDRHARRIELPESDRDAVRAPAEAVTDAELLFADPIGRAVDDVRPPVGGQLDDAPRGQVFGIDVVLDDIGGLPAVGRELGEHQARGLEIPAELAEATGGQFVGPEVAARVLAPDAFRVCEDDEHLAVRRPGVVLDVQRPGGGGRDEPGGGNQNRAPTGFSAVENEVAAAFRLRAGLERRVGFAVAHPAGRAEALGGEFATGEDPLDGQDGVEGFLRHGLFLGRGSQGGNPNEEEGEEDEGLQASGHGSGPPWVLVHWGVRT